MSSLIKRNLTHLSGLFFSFRAKLRSFKKNLFKKSNAKTVFNHERKTLLNNKKISGYKGIWFTLNQFYRYGGKYSGGLGSYSAKHIPMGIYNEEIDTTFFVYGGTIDNKTNHLLCMIGSFNHTTGMLSKPTVVYDKEGVKDPHDNPSLNIDSKGHIWVFVSGRANVRPGYVFKSKTPFNIDAFEKISDKVMAYPQIWYDSKKGFLTLFTKYSGIRELYFQISKDGLSWSKKKKLVGIRENFYEKSGHYQISNYANGILITFFNWHPHGNVDKRTNLYYLQSIDLGKTWTTIQGQQLRIPLIDVDSPALVFDYRNRERNVYLKDTNFDIYGNPIVLYLTSKGHEPGPENGLREWRVLYWNGKKWIDNFVCHSSHNYDMGSLFVENNAWKIIAPTVQGPQKFGSGGEIAMWLSSDSGKNWKKVKIITNKSDRNHNYIRRVVNGKSPFSYFWTDGDTNKQSISRIYFGNLEGDFWKLPYKMKAQTHFDSLDKQSTY